MYPINCPPKRNVSLSFDKERKTSEKSSSPSKLEPILTLDKQKRDTFMDGLLRAACPSGYQWPPELSKIVFNYYDNRTKMDSSIKKLASPEGSFYESTNLFRLILEEICALLIDKNDMKYVIKYTKEFLYNLIVENKEVLGKGAKEYYDVSDTFVPDAKKEKIFRINSSDPDKSSQFLNQNIEIFIKKNAAIILSLAHLNIRIDLIYGNSPDIFFFSHEANLHQGQTPFPRSLRERLPGEEKLTNEEKINKEKSWMLGEVQSMIELYENKKLIREED